MAVKLARLVLFSLLAASASGATEPPAAAPSGDALEKQFREALDIAADAEFVFLGADGKPLTGDEFARDMQKRGLSAGVEKDPSGKKVTVRMMQVPSASAPSGPTHLPALDAKDLAGRAVRTADLRGKPTLLNFFFAACVPCIKEVPILNEFRRGHPEYNYVAVTFDPATAARQFHAQHKFEWSIVPDAKQFIDAAGVRGYPTYMLVAADGKILARNSGLGVDAMKDPKVGLAHFEKWVAKGQGGEP